MSMVKKVALTSTSIQVFTAFVTVRLFRAFVSYVTYGAWYEILGKGLCFP